jgi:cobalamin transport system substrate-binding protein
VRRTVCIILLALTAAACNDKAPEVIPVSRSVTYPLEIAAPNGPVEIPRQPLRIVSLSPTATEILFAIGAGPQVLAVDDQSNYPANAPKTKLSGFEPNVEAIAKYSPDLVVFANDVKQLAKGLAALKIPALLQPAATSLDDTYEQIAQLGDATDHPNEADKLTAKMKKDIALIAADAPTFTSQPTFYHELDSTYFSATSSTFIGKVYALLHLRNIADPADKQSSGYPQLSPEYIVQSDPDLIFLADTKCCAQSATTVAKRPGWDKIRAVKNDGVVALDDDIASRWGPRVVDFLRTVAAALKGLDKAA